MIHAGSIVGAAMSQGKTITFGFDTSWTKFQDLRNDRSKRDFVTFGAAAGVAAAFQAPIGIYPIRVPWLKVIMATFTI